jgi:hypothetical protein
MPALQTQSLEFKPQSHQKKKGGLDKKVPKKHKTLSSSPSTEKKKDTYIKLKNVHILPFLASCFFAM